MATRLCWRKRSRMLQHCAAPGAAAAPSSDLVHPLHRSVSHSCPAHPSPPVMACHGSETAPKYFQVPTRGLVLGELAHVRHVYAQIHVDCNPVSTTAVSHHSFLHDSFSHPGGTSH